MHSISARENPQAAASLPRVGVIADYLATGLMTGCGNVYVTPVADRAKSPPPYVFLSGPEGENAWMNLDGRDTRLKHLKSWTSEEADPMQRTFYSDYSFGAVRVHIVSRPDHASVDGVSRVKIILSHGKARRVIDALGSSDC